MKLGLLTDIYEQVELLRIALDHFRQEQVDKIVLLGDVFETGERIEETCRLLGEARAIGVWGNHAGTTRCLNWPVQHRWSVA
ncbi:MAG: metallophosphoesterase family protein [Planctomycetes bacterium]|nr:metallophosphoesterase family protein [Planctomycetota bacterium]MBL7041504.1 metallophosphoesterase family protein [Pirellulaceae bacterium]